MSIYYALGRISLLGRDALNRQKLDRLLQAQDETEARRILSEIGWNADEDMEQAAEDHIKSACKAIRELTVQEKTLDAFLLRYDVNNLKILMKSRVLGISSDAVSSCGTISPDALRHAVTERNYRVLPPLLKSAADELEKKLAANADPFIIDVELDKAMYRSIMETLPKKDRVARSYFSAQIDLTNLIMALRAVNIGRNAAFFKELLLPGGTVEERKWLKAYEKPETLPALVKGYGIKVFNAANAAYLSKEKIPALEKAMDDYLLSLYLPFKQVSDQNERLIGYLLMRQREAAAVKLIIAGKKGGFKNEAIQERLRELYA